jgi:hypothetical protein
MRVIILASEGLVIESTEVAESTEKGGIRIQDRKPVPSDLCDLLTLCALFVLKTGVCSTACKPRRHRKKKT